MYIVRLIKNRWWGSENGERDKKKQRYLSIRERWMQGKEVWSRARKKEREKDREREREREKDR